MKYYGNSAIISNEVIKSYGQEIKTISTNFNEKKVTSKTRKIPIFYLPFY